MGGGDVRVTPWTSRACWLSLIGYTGALAVNVIRSGSRLPASWPLGLVSFTASIDQPSARYSAKVAVSAGFVGYPWSASQVFTASGSVPDNVDTVNGPTSDVVTDNPPGR